MSAQRSPVADSSCHTAAEWYSWLTQTVANLKETYRLCPDHIASGYHRERAQAREYCGRELLELLQNADDAAEPGRAKALLRLEPEGLLVANTGTCFSEFGVASLMFPDNSPKILNKKRYIGSKGLGFRAVLGWSPRPFLLSGQLRIGFDAEHASQVLDGLRADSVGVAAAMKRLEDAGMPCRIPTLAMPFILETDSLHDRAPRSGYQRLLAIAGELRAQDYDTVVVLPFDGEEGHAKAHAQMEQIGRELLLFTKQLTEVRLQNGTQLRTWRVERADDLVEIRIDDKPAQLWTIYRDRDAIPNSLLPDGEQQEQDYEVKLAIAHDESYEYRPFLYTYFPTQALFPFPLLAHATLDLSNNRQNVLETEVNRFVVSKLAKLIAVAAEKVGRDNLNPDRCRPLAMITPQGSIDPVLGNLELLPRLKEAAAPRAIVPLRTGQLVPAAIAKCLDRAVIEWLPSEGFTDLVSAQAVAGFHEGLALLDVPTLPQRDLFQRLEQSSRSGQMSIEARARMIVGFGGLSLEKGSRAPSLLVDDADQVIDASATVHLSPEGTKFELPAWVPLRILGGGLTKELRHLFKISTGRDLVSRMTAFPIREYSLQSIMLGILSAGHEYVEKSNDNKPERIAEVLRAVFRIYASVENPPSKPFEGVRALTRKGTIALVKELYLGGEYAGGQLTEELYRTANPARLIASPDVLGLKDVDPQELVKFLCCLGAETQPREQVITAPKDFREYFLGKLEYPVYFGDVEVHGPDELTESDAHVTSIDGLDEILARANPHAIIAWLDADARIERWRSGGDSSATLLFKPPRKRESRNLRQQPDGLQSYVTWRIATTVWLPTSNGGHRPPCRCLTTPLTTSPEIHRLLPQPQLATSYPLLQRMGIDSTKIRHALERAGVHTSIDTIPWEDCYQLLSELPESDPTGASAKALYRSLAARNLDAEPRIGDSCAAFHQCGLLFGSQAGMGSYFPVQSLYYDDGGVLPPNVARELPLLALERRRGANKVKRIFGVTPLDASKVDIHIRDFALSPHSNDFEREFGELKPFLYVLRSAEAAASQGLSKLPGLTGRLYLSVSGVATLEDQKFELKLSMPGDFVINGSDILIIAGPTEPSGLLRDELLADVVSEAVARVLGIDRKPDFARIAACSPERRCALVARILDRDVKSVQALLDQAAQQMRGLISPVTAHGPALWTAPSERSTTSTNKSKVDAEPDLLRPSPPIIEVVAIQQQHVPLPPSQRVEFRNTPEPAEPPGSGGPRRVVDWRVCERIAFLFEESQGRFPLAVGHLQGYAAFGCDILSFVSVEHRAQFQSNPSRENILRFIEVKGGSREDGIVQLTNNERSNAQSESARYFIYRLYAASSREWKLLTLQNPLQNPPRVIYEINLRRAPQTQSWVVTGIDEHSG